MSSETSGGFSVGARDKNEVHGAGTAGAGATDPMRGTGAAKGSDQGMGHGVKSAAAGVHVSQTLRRNHRCMKTENYGNIGVWRKNSWFHCCIC